MVLTSDGCITKFDDFTYVPSDNSWTYNLFGGSNVSILRREILAASRGVYSV